MMTRDVYISHRGGVVWRTLVVAAALQSFQTVLGCILLLDGWSPMPVGERATLADIVAVGVVRRTFKADRTGDAVATYSAEVRLIDVFKGRRLVDSVHHSSTSGYTGNSLTSVETQFQLTNTSGETVINFHMHNSDYISTPLDHSKQVSNEFMTRERSGKGIRSADSGPATDVLRTCKF